MVKVILPNDKTHLLPVSTLELSLDMGIQLLSSLRLEDKTSPNFKRSILAILLKCEVELLSEVPDYKIEILYEKIPYLNDKLVFNYYESFKLKGKLYGLIDFDKIIVEEFLDISSLFEDENDNLDKILSILYRKIIQREQNPKNILLNTISYLLLKGPIRGKKFKSFKTEEYKDQSNADLFRKNFSYASGQGAILHFLEWKANFEKEFWQMFENGKDPDQEEDYDPFANLEDEQPKRKELPSLGEVWGLFHLLFEVCNGDKIQMDHWMKKPIREFFTHCIYVKQRNTYLEKLNNHGG